MLKEYMITLGYTKDVIAKIRTTYPVIKCSEEYLEQSIKDHFKLFREYGYSDNQIIKMTIERPHLFCFEISLLNEKINYLEQLLGNKKAVIKATTDFPTIYSYDIISMQYKIEQLIEIGYEKDNLIKNIKIYPELLGLNIEENVKSMIKEFQTIGFTLTEILSITSKNMSIFGRNIDTIKNTIQIFENYGYTKKTVISMIKKHPQILNYSQERIKQRILDITQLIGDEKTVLDIIEINPSLFGNDLDTIIDKKIFYDSIGLVDFFIKSPKDLIQGISKTYARYQYLKSIGIDIFATKNGYNILFIGEKKFQKKYQITTAELIEKYGVEKYMQEVKTKQKTKTLTLTK